ncbi:MAG: transposase [Phormidesmis sp. CAN_BIN44]|nr:transposase [Phormidesmis sp. CAN_BIN44]
MARAVDFLYLGKGSASPAQLAYKFPHRVPKTLTQRYRVIVLADTEFGTVEFLTAVHKRRWRAVVGMRLMHNGTALKQLYRTGNRGQQVQLAGLDLPLTVSWFWLKRSEGERELRFVVSTYPYSGSYLVQLGRQRRAIEGFFKTIKHRFGLHCFGQKTRLGVYRWLLLSLITYLLVHWVSRLSPTWVRLDWGNVSAQAIAQLFPQLLWIKLLRQIQTHRDLADDLRFEIHIQSIPLPC